MSESLTGVTFLAFGNGSPDVFSTFAAFSSHSGSLAVGELMGAACFITAVVAGSMAITKPFRVGKKAFVRDVLLFAIAASFSLNFLKDGSLRMWESIVMIGFYVVYVIFVVAWHWFFERRRRIRLAETAARLHQYIPDQQELEVPEIEDDEEGRPAGERSPLIRTGTTNSAQSGYNPGTPAWAYENVDDMDDEVRDQYLAALSSNMRVSRTGRERRNTVNPIRPSLIGALEFRAVLNALEKKSTNADPIYMRRYSEDGRNLLAQIAESQASISHPELLSHSAQHSGTQSPVPKIGGRGRAVSAGDADTARRNRDKDTNLLDVQTGTPETAIYSPIAAVRPTSDGTDSSQVGHRRSISHQSNNLLLSPNSIPSSAASAGNVTPGSLSATRNGLLAPPEPSFFTLQHSGDHGRSDGGGVSPGAISPGAISPLALVPRLEIPHQGHRNMQDWHYTDSPSAMSSRPPSIYLPPPSMSPESSRLFSLRGDEVAIPRQITWWPYNYLPAPRVLLSTLFPGLYDWSEKSWPDRVLAVCTAPSIFLLTITVPVVEPDSDDSVLAEAPLLTPLVFSPELSRTATPGRFPPGSPITVRRVDEQGVIPQIRTSAEDDTPHSSPKEWNRWLAIVQTFTAPLFMVFIIWTNIESDVDGEERSHSLLVKMILVSLVFSLVCLALLITVTSPTREPKQKPFLCFLGFFVAIAWISTIAGEVVGVLKTFGVILNISDAILGLTIFAVGNSLGDLVADITVARLGYPMMALSACFGGPMLNILLGIGIGGLYQTISNARDHRREHPNKPWHYKPYELDISTTLLVSGATLLLTLVFLLVVVPLNNWRMDRKIGVALIAIWATSTVLNVVLEVVGIGQTE